MTNWVRVDPWGYILKVSVAYLIFWVIDILIIIGWSKWLSESESEGVDRNVIIVIFHVTKCNEQGMDKACAIDTTGGCNKIAVKVTYWLGHS